jgi:hypothetical protein
VVLEDCSSAEAEAEESWISALQPIGFQQLFEYDKERSS